MVNILKALQQKHDVTQMLTDATVSIRDALECERVTMWFEDGSGNLDSLDVSTDDANAEHLSQLFAAIARYSCEEKVLINANNIYQDDDLWLAIQDFVDVDKFLQGNNNNMDNDNDNSNGIYRFESSSILCVPIATASSNGRVVGVIQAIFKANDESFTEEDQMILEAVSSEVAHTIARNISDLCLQKYIERHEDVPLDVIDYYLTGSYELQRQKSDSLYDNYPIEWENESQMTDESENDENFDYTSNGNKTDEKGDGEDRDDEFSPTNAIVVGSDGKPIVVDRRSHKNSKHSKHSKQKAAKLYEIKIDPQLTEYLKTLGTCDFDCTEFDFGEHLEQCAMWVFDEIGLIEEFNLNVAKLQRFIHNVSKKYRANPFHNWQHGFFVFQFVYYFLCNDNIMKQYFRKCDILAILVAGMCHDVDHPGNDNLFEINCDTELARIYNGESVLENHHAYTTMALLRKPELNFMESIPLNMQKDLKRTIVRSILTTDMSHHIELIEWLHDLIKDDVMTMFETNKLKDSEKSNTIMKICQCVVHLGDLSPQTYPWKIAKEWESRIAREFKQQTIKESQSNIMVREWMSKTDLMTRYKNQHFFIEHVVKPLWVPTAQLFPQMKSRLESLNSNSKKYKAIAAKRAKEQENSNNNQKKENE